MESIQDSPTIGRSQIQYSSSPSSSSSPTTYTTNNSPLPTPSSTVSSRYVLTFFTSPVFSCFFFFFRFEWVGPACACYCFFLVLPLNHTCPCTVLSFPHSLRTCTSSSPSCKLILFLSCLPKSFVCRVVVVIVIVALGHSKRPTATWIQF